MNTILVLLLSILMCGEYIPTDCEGDTNASGTVDVDDLLCVINNWGAECPTLCPFDPNGSGVANVDDLLTVINNWGECK
jgi:hypothetical protein